MRISRGHLKLLDYYKNKSSLMIVLRKLFSKLKTLIFGYISSALNSDHPSKMDRYIYHEHLCDVNVLAK